MATEIDAAKVLSSYIEMLARASSTVIRDVSELPYPKDVIKLVLMHCVKLAGEGKERELLRSAYVNLADFQPLSADELRSLRAWNSVIAEHSERMADEPLVDAAKVLSGVGDLVLEVNKRVTREAATLLEELKSAGF